MTGDATRWPLVRSIVEACLDLDANGRVARLDELCREDPALRADVEALLAADDSDDDLFATPVAEWAGELIADVATATAPNMPTRIGPYDIVDVIGRGGMGTVYRAVREGGDFERKVAIKLVHTGLNTQSVIARFETERQILAALDHPNIATLYDGGLTQDGAPYFIMECIDGVSIDQYCSEQALDLDARVELFEAVSDAVQHAHQNLIVHRDLKPSNILVTGGGRVKLLDFGIAKVLDDDANAPHTVADDRWMTLSYASPEQLRGESVTTQSDVYALGALLYHLIAGRLPFVRQDDGPTPLEQVLRGDEPSRPSSIATHAWRRRLRGDLDTIVSCALKAEPHRRYPTAAALRDDRVAFRNDQPVSARPDTLGYRGRKFIRRHRMACSIALCLTIALIGTTLFAVDSARQAEHDSSVARAEREVDDRERDNAERQRRLAVDSQSISDEIVENGAARLREEFHDRAFVRSRLLEALGRVYFGMGSCDAAEAMLEEAFQLRQSIAGRAPPDPQSKAALSKAALSKAALSEAALCVNLAFVKRAKGDYERAEALYRQALQIRRALRGDVHIGIAECLNNLGELAGQRAQFKRARDLLEQSVQIQRELGREQTLSFAKTINNLSSLDQELGDFDRAIAMQRESLDIRKRVAGPDSAVVAAGHNSLGVLLSA